MPSPTSIAEDALEPGAIIDGEYRVDGVLGAGGMGVVYRARDLRLDRPLALKLHRDKGQAHERLAREATALARLAHPNVVGVFRVGSHHGRIYVAMELIEGGTLRRRGEAPRPWRDTVRLYCAAGDGLAAAHAAGLVHRDFKPDNVLLGTDGRPRVADFGLARAAGERSDAADPATLATAETVDSAAATNSRPATSVAGGARSDPPAGSIAGGMSAALAPADYLTHISEHGRTPLDARLTVTGAWVGTPAYMAPEQIDGAGVDARSDQFSFAVALWEGLHGRRPFAGETTLSLRAAIARQDIQPGERNDVPGRIDDLLRRALRERPADRWPSMDAMLVALRHDPGARRRQIALGIGAVALAAGTAAIAWQARGGGTARPHCDGGAGEIGAVWGPTEAAALRARFAASALPYAPELAIRVAGTLDRYADAWARGHNLACTARADGTWSAALADRAVVCLARRRRSLSEAVALLHTVEAKHIDDAGRVSDNLPPIDECLDPARIENAKLPPTDPALARRHEEVVTALGRADALLDLYDARGRAAAEEAHTLARALGDQDLIVEAEWLLAQVAYVEGDPDVRSRFEQVFFDARTAGADSIANATALRLVHISLAERREDDARTWMRHATAGVGERPTAKAQLSLAIAEAVLDQRAGKLDDAIAKLEIARRAIAALPEADAYLPDLLDLESALLGTIGDMSRAIIAGRESVTRTETHYGGSYPGLVGRLSNLALNLTETGVNEEAVALMERAIAICQGSGRCIENMPMHLLNLGVVQANAKRYEAALATLDQADEGLEAQGERGLADRALVASSRGVVYEELDRLDEAAASIRTALELLEKTVGPDHPDTAHALSNLGSVLNAGGKYAEAVPMLQRAIAIWNQVSDDATGRALPMLGLGRAQLGLGRHADAVATLRKAVELLEKGGFSGFVPTARLRLAQAQWGAGEREAARATTAMLPAAEADGVNASLAGEIKAWRATIGAAR